MAKISYLCKKVQMKNGKRSEQDNDAIPTGDDSGAMATDSTGGLENDRDRSDIRMYEEGLAIGDNAHSDLSERARRRAESERLIAIAKHNGNYIEHRDVLSWGTRLLKKTGESEVIVAHTDRRVYKLKDPYAKSPLKGNVHPEDVIFEHLVHNKYFPETRYTFEGISEDLGDVRIILSQKFIESVKRPSKKHLEKALAEKGIFPDGRYSYGNEEISITDLTGDNALLGEDGNVYFIDPIINFKKPVRDVIG